MLTLFAGYAVETGELVKLLIQARRHNPESLAQVPHNDGLRNSHIQSSPQVSRARNRGLLARSSSVSRFI
jgi:hypothetical protein